MSVTGSCLCGAVQYTIQADPKETGACHCSMCRKWSGGVFLGVQVAADHLDIKGAEHIATYRSSEWAERAFCKTCGSSLYYRVTAEGPHHGTYHVGLGTMDAVDEIALTQELFIDRKPNGYSFAQKTEALTEADVFALFAQVS